ncbi:unnamed protein product [Moneuplotes crassus]|uniref:Uncharacterized protein n=1 Tax=Euplotes crassus TaxID=5936 RepID=A0AAD1U9L7_EUPCR|nr:unnamed protein product [Moneuplotes crassus]
MTIQVLLSCATNELNQERHLLTNFLRKDTNCSTNYESPILDPVCMNSINSSRVIANSDTSGMKIADYLSMLQRKSLAKSSRNLKCKKPESLNVSKAYQVQSHKQINSAKSPIFKTSMTGSSLADKSMQVYSRFCKEKSARSLDKVREKIQLKSLRHNDRYVEKFNQRAMQEEYDSKTMKANIKIVAEDPYRYMNLNFANNGDKADSYLEKISNSHSHNTFGCRKRSLEAVSMKQLPLKAMNKDISFTMKEKPFEQNPRSVLHLSQLKQSSKESDQSRNLLNSSKQSQKTKLAISSVRKTHNPIDVLLESIDAKKKEVRKLIEKKKIQMQKEKIFEEKVKQKAFKSFRGPLQDKFIDQIRQKDSLIGGPSFIDQFSKINSRVDSLKMKGLRIIIQQHLEKKNAEKKEKIRKTASGRRLSLVPTQL